MAPIPDLRAIRALPKPLSHMNLPSNLPSPNLKLGLNFGRRSGADIVGLDIQPGFVAAVRASVNRSIIAERAASVALAADTIRDGEVVDEAALAEALKELFGAHNLGKR